MLLSLYDFHGLPKRHQALALNYLVKIIMDGLQAYRNQTFIVNSCPFVNESNELDPEGGLYVSAGKGSHSYYTGEDGYARMKSNAGLRNGTVYVLMLFVTPQNCAKGEFHLKFSQCYDDAEDYIKYFSANGGSKVVRDHWEQSAKTILRLLRFTPVNLHPSEKLNACEAVVNKNLFNTGRLQFCKSCNDFATCTVNLQVKETLKERG